jgi:hypothetical protein
MGYLGRMTQWKVRDNLQQKPTHSYADVVLRVNYHSRPTPPLSTPQTTKTP